MCPPADQMTCPTLLATTYQGIRRDTWDYSSPAWGWPGLVVHSMLTIPATAFLSAVRAKAKHPFAICPSQMEHNGGLETSASNDNYTVRPSSQGKSHTMTTVCHIEECGGWPCSSSTLSLECLRYIYMTIKVCEKTMCRSREMTWSAVNLSCQTACVSPFLSSVLLI